MKVFLIMIAIVVALLIFYKSYNSIKDKSLEPTLKPPPIDPTAEKLEMAVKKRLEVKDKANLVNQIAQAKRTISEEEKKEVEQAIEKTNQAVKMIQEIINTKPIYTNTHYELGMCYLQLFYLEQPVEGREINPIWPLYLEYAKREFREYLRLEPNGIYSNSARFFVEHLGG